MRLITAIVYVTSAAALSPIFASAELRPDRIHVAEAKKTRFYVRDGMIVGGDKAIDQVVIKDIRRAANEGFERIVIDLEGIKNGDPAAIARPPFYQVSVTPDEKRIVFTIWGKPKLEFDSRKVLNAFKKSYSIRNVVLLPVMEEDTWTFAFELKGGTPVEVFELSNPVRVILDVKATKPVKTASAKPIKTKTKAKAKTSIDPELPEGSEGLERSAVGE